MRLLGTGLLIACLGIVGCGPDIQGTCEAQVSCSGGDERDIDACVATSEIYVDFLDDINCGDEFEAYELCVEPLRTCRTQAIGQPCMQTSDCGDSLLSCSGGECVFSSYGLPDDKADACEAEKRAYSRCSKF